MPDNTLGTAQNLGILGSYTLTRNDFVGSSDPMIFPPFELNP